MAVVALIPTGKLEHAALGPALARLFPDHAFVVRPPEQHLDGFTSRDVAQLLGAGLGPVPGNLDDLAAELANSIFPARRGEHIDFAFVVEDLELCNQHQPDLVLRIFREALDSYISQTWPQQSAPRFKEVRERCSFHLFRPMMEAYFFGEPAALARAKAARPHQLPEALTSRCSVRWTKFSCLFLPRALESRTCRCVNSTRNPTFITCATRRWTTGT